MKKFTVSSLLLIIILGLIAIFYFDLLGLSKSKEATLASIIAAEDTRRVTGKFDDYINDPDPDIRARAALAIGRIGDTDAARALFVMLEDSVAEVAETAAFAIGLTGERRFAANLLDVCSDFKPELLAMCIRSVGFLSDSGMTDVNELAASYLTHVDHRVREQAAYAVWRSSYYDGTDMLINVCRNDPVRPVQIAALYALVRMRIEKPGDLYAEWLPDSDPYVRLLAIGGLSLGKDDSKTSIIASGLNDRDNNVVAQAINALTGIGSERAIERLKSKYAVEDDEKLKVLLLESFARLGDDAIVDYALDDIHTQESINIKAAAIHYLSRIKKEEMIPLIDSLHDLGDNYLKARIADALGTIGGEAIKPRLVSLYKDSSVLVRAAAFETICAVDPGNIDYYIKTALADDDFVLQGLAIDKIGQIKDPDFLPQLKSLIKDGAEAHVTVKRSVVDAAGNFLGGDADSLAEDILYRGLLDREYVVSKDAAKIYKAKLNQDKSAFISYPKGLISSRKIKSQLGKYRENPKAKIITAHGEIEMELYFDIAPLTVYNFIRLAKEGFYDSLDFHRVIPAFVVQGGDPHGDGWGGPGYTIRCEYSPLTFKRGTVGIAHSGRDTGGSQFFITLMPLPHLDSRYTVFGQVISGMEVVDQIVRGDKIEHIEIITGADE